MSLQAFKEFVRERPSLVKYVENKEVTWQQFYEMYELYGGSSNVWDKYLSSSTTSSFSLKDMFGMFRNINQDDLQKGIDSLQKGIGYIQDLVQNRSNNTNMRRSSYDGRPLYRYFDD